MSGPSAPESTAANAALADALKQAAREIGFDLVGIAPAVTPGTYPQFLDWLDRGFAGEMQYLPGRREAREHPRSVLPSVNSVIMLAVNYLAKPASSPSAPARIASYAQIPRDYHDVIRGMLKQLAAHLHQQAPGCQTRGVVDTAPLLERDFARLAGLGWFGKNTLLINRRAGSFLFLAALLTDVPLPADAPHETDHCGTCTRCLTACPTDAFPEPYVLDATKCISYLTIESKTAFPRELRSGVGEWLFGCDICQDVCPWNRKAPPAKRPEFQSDPQLNGVDPVRLLQMSEAEFDTEFRQTPLARPGWNGMRRNAAVVLGNRQDSRAVPALSAALSDSHASLRATAAWALGKIGGEQALAALQHRRECEDNPDVLHELDLALQSLARPPETGDRRE